MPHRTLLSFTALFAFAAHAQTTPSSATPPPGPQTDTAVISPDGTAHVTRVVPLSPVLSPEARAAYSKAGTDASNMESDVMKRRVGTQAWQDGAGKQSAAVYPVKITEGQTMGGVPVRIVDPLPHELTGVTGGGKSGCTAEDQLHYSAVPRTQGVACGGQGPAIDIHPDRVLMCLHGGGFNSDSGSYTESIPIANLTRTRVVSVLYRLAPEHPYPAALDDAIAVYRELLKTYKPANIVVYGTSAGAILTSEVVVRLKQLHVPEPAALGIFSGLGDFYTPGDSSALFTLGGFTGPLQPPPANPDRHSLDPEYTGSADVLDPTLDPVHADLHGLPPTLFITSSRDFLESGTTTMQRAWMRDGVRTEMVAFDGLPHAFWNDVSLPESREAYAAMARFFLEQMSK